MNLSELAENSIIHPMFHVPGLLNPADIPTKANSTGKDVQADSMWKCGPEYLLLPREEWPLSREFLDYIPQQELRSSKAFFNAVQTTGAWKSVLGTSISRLVTQVIDRSNCLRKVRCVTACLLTCISIGTET